MRELRVTFLVVSLRLPTRKSQVISSGNAALDSFSQNAEPRPALVDSPLVRASGSPSTPPRRVRQLLCLQKLFENCKHERLRTCLAQKNCQRPILKKCLQILSQNSNRTFAKKCTVPVLYGLPAKPYLYSLVLTPEPNARQSIHKHTVTLLNTFSRMGLAKFKSKNNCQVLHMNIIPFRSRVKTSRLQALLRAAESGYWHLQNVQQTKNYSSGRCDTYIF